MELRLDYSPGACVFLALLCLTVPLDWITAFFLAAAVHECCHILAVRFLGGRIYTLKIGVRGAIMDASEMTPARELICILAGSCGSLALLLFRRFIPKTAICGMIHGLFNLLPVYPLDGGRVVLCVLNIYCLPRTAEKWCMVISRLFCSILMLSLFWYFRISPGILSVYAAVLFLIKAFLGKSSCKEGNMGVQYDHHI